LFIPWINQGFIFKNLSEVNMMKKFQSLIVDQTPKTPLIDLNQFSGDLIFFGKSIPENAARVYEPVLNWVTDYILKARPITNLRLNLEYFNTSSVLWLSKIFKALISINEPDYVLFVHLYLPEDDYDEINDFEDIKDAFIPIGDIVQGKIANVGIKLHALDYKGEICKESLVLI
jgi:SiaC family regulatory phosphoprotein